MEVMWGCKDKGGASLRRTEDIEGVIEGSWVGEDIRT